MSSTTECKLCDVDHRRGSEDCPASRLGRVVAGKYTLESLMGVGGMGAVYRARHASLGVDVAIKMIHRRFAHNEAIAARFDQEAKRVARLRHPGIVTVADLGRDTDGSPYLEMELLDGTPVDVLAANGLPLERAVEIVVQVLDALEYAHGQGIVHRDLKPENLFLVGDQVKILDFGIAKALEGQGDGGMTATGSLMGTPRYMSPEQFTDSKHVDARTDIYAMGATLFELLTGKHTVSGESYPEVMTKILAGNIERHPRTTHQQLPAWVDEVVSRALARSADDRYPSAAEMRTAITHHAEYAESETATSETTQTPVDDTAGNVASAAPPVEPTTPPRRRWMPAVLGGGVLIAVVAVIAVVASHGKGAAATTPSDAAPKLAPAPDATPAPPTPPPPPDGMIRLAAATVEVGSRPDEITADLAWCSKLAKMKCPDALYQREQPVQKIEVGAFDLDRTEVTNAAFAAALADARIAPPDDDEVLADGQLLAIAGTEHSGVAYRDGRYVAVDDLARLPMVRVTWEGARWFCQRAGKRLPTEVEWERAARGVDRRRFPWGDDTELGCDDIAIERGKDMECAAKGDRPSPVGSSPRDATPEGVLDLGGNVAEWVADAFRDRYPKCHRDCIVAAEPGSDVKRVVRGGYFDGLAESARGAGRSRFDHDATNINVGFRCAKEVP